MVSVTLLHVGSWMVPHTWSDLHATWVSRLRESRVLRFGTLESQGLRLALTWKLAFLVWRLPPGKGPVPVLQHTSRAGCS